MKGMKIIAVLCLLALAGLPALAQQDKPKEGMGDAGKPDMAAMMQAMEKAATPGDNHKHLGRYVGDWTTSMKMWMDPSQPPMESTGTLHAEWILGGRYVESTYKGDFMGQPFEGRAIDGYDNVAGKFVSSWVDNVGTGIAHGTGTCDEGCKTSTMMSEMMDPMTGQPATSRMVTTWLDDKTFRMEMFMKDPSGQEMKGMEMTAKKK